MKNKLLLYLIGKPGAGKGTVSQNIVKQLQADHVIASKLLFGFLYQTYGENSNEVKDILNAKTISYYPALDTLVMQSIVNSTKDLIVLDGYPRIEEQLKKHLMLLNSEVKTRNYKKIIVELDISDESAFKRIQYRRICNNCTLVYSAALDKLERCNICDSILITRKDDNLEAFKNRIQTYKQTQDTMNKFTESVDSVIKINVERPVAEVLAQILNMIKTYLG